MLQHDQYRNIQDSVDHLLGIKSTVRRKKKTQSERKKELFFFIMTLMEESIVRSNLAYHELQLDLFKFEEKYIQIIDMLMEMNFGEELMDIIGFYLYDRMLEDGTVIPITTEDGQEILLKTPYDLWNLLVAINPRIDA
jgi:hypothetical protein